MDALTVDAVYGQALFDAAKDAGRVDEIGAEYRAVSRVFSENPALKKLFLIPTVSATDKKRVAVAVFGGHISKELVNFICVLIDKRRTSAWDGIGRHYDKLLDDREGLTKGIAYSVVPLGAERIAALEEKSGQMLGKTVKLENRIDSSLIGGVRIYADGKLIDASVRARLDAMKQKIQAQN